MPMQSVSNVIIPHPLQSYVPVQAPLFLFVLRFIYFRGERVHTHMHQWVECGEGGRISGLPAECGA